MLYDETNMGAEPLDLSRFWNNAGSKNTGAMSILQNFAKTVFNKCANSKSAEASLSPMEQAKFDAAQKMMREGKTTRYAYNKFKAEFEKPLFDSYRQELSRLVENDNKTRDLSDWSMRKLAGFLDKLDQEKLAALQERPDEYAAFLGQAHEIAVAHARRSKFKSIDAALDKALTLEIKSAPLILTSDMRLVDDNQHAGAQTIETNIAFTMDDLYALILSNIQDASDLTKNDVVAEIKSFAQAMDAPLRQLEEQKSGYGLGQTTFRLLKNFLGVNGSNRSRHNNITKMCALICAFHPDLAGRLMHDLGDAEKTGSHDGFLAKHAGLLEDTYIAALESGLLVKGEGEISEADIQYLYGIFDDAYQFSDRKEEAPVVNSHAAQGFAPLSYSRNERAVYTRFPRAA